MAPSKQSTLFDYFSQSRPSSQVPLDGTVKSFSKFYQPLPAPFSSQFTSVVNGLGLSGLESFPLVSSNGSDDAFGSRTESHLETGTLSPKNLSSIFLPKESMIPFESNESTSASLILSTLHTWNYSSPPLTDKEDWIFSSISQKGLHNTLPPSPPLSTHSSSANHLPLLKDSKGVHSLMTLTPVWSGQDFLGKPCQSMESSPISISKSLASPIHYLDSLAPKPSPPTSRHTVHCRRSKLGPFRSICPSLSDDKIFQLDVFSLCARNPGLLFPRGSQSTCSTSSSSVFKEDSKPSRRNLRQKRLRQKRLSDQGTLSNKSSSPQKLLLSLSPDLNQAPSIDSPSLSAIQSGRNSSQSNRQGGLMDLNEELLSREKYTVPYQTAVPKPVQSARGTIAFFAF